MEYLWHDVSAGKFSQLLLQIRDENYPESEEKIIIPSGLRMVVGSFKISLSWNIFRRREISKKNLWFGCEREREREREILTPKNYINDIVLNLIEGENIDYRSVDSVLEIDNAVQVFQLIDLF